MSTVTLWRATGHPSNLGPPPDLGHLTSWTSHEGYARSFMRPSGFGGRYLYRAEIELAPGDVIELADVDPYVPNEPMKPWLMAMDLVEILITCNQEYVSWAAPPGEDEERFVLSRKIVANLRNAGFKWLRCSGDDPDNVFPRTAEGIECDEWKYLGDEPVPANPERLLVALEFGPPVLQICSASSR